MRITIALTCLAVLSVSSKERTVRIVTWNVENYTSPPSNLEKIFGSNKFDMIFIALQGVANDESYKRWDTAVNNALTQRKLGMYTKHHYKNNAHFMSHKKQYDSKFSTLLTIDYVPFKDDTAMMLVTFIWHKKKFGVIHGRAPIAEDKSTKNSHYESMKRIVNGHDRTERPDFYFIAGDISYFSDKLTEKCWNINGTDPALGKTFPSNIPMPTESSRIMYKAYRLVKLESYGYLGGSASKALKADYKIDIDTTKKP